MPDGAAIVRAMPNTPAAIGRGVTVAVANANVTPAQRALADELMGAVGEVLWVEDEALLDPVTAVSGSGPAYVFLLAECLAEAGRAAGLEAELADRLARATIVGAAALLEQSDLSVCGSAQERDLARRHHGGGAGDPGWSGRLADAHDGGGGRRNETRPRAGKMS